MNNKKYLANDEAVVELKSEKDLKEYLAFRKEHDVWYTPYVNECKIVGVSNTLLFFEQEANDIKGSEKFGVSLKCDCIRETVEEAAADNGILIVFPSNDHYEVYPLRYTGFIDLCKRSGLEGRTMTLMQKKGQIEALDTHTKGQWFSTGCKLNGESCKILIRDGKASNMKSKEYSIIPADEAVSALEMELSGSWPEYTYSTGMVSHEYLIVDYLLNDTAMEESLRLRLESLGLKCQGSVQSGVRFSTSDVGNSCVTAAPYFTINGTKVRIGNPIAVRHNSENNATKFSEQLIKMATLLREAEDKIEELGNTNINCIVGCVQNVCEKYSNLIPTKAAEKVIDDLLVQYGTTGSGTAVDVFIALNEIVNVQNVLKPMNPTQLIKLSEGISQLMFVDYEEYDLPYENKTK